MLKITQSFSEENNTFQRFVFIYEYIEFLNEHSSIREILQKIFEETARLASEVEAHLLSDSSIDDKGQVLFAKEFWANYTRLGVVHGKMKEFQKERSPEKLVLDGLSRHFSKPYSDHLLQLSFKVINTEVFDRLDKLHFLQAGAHIGRTYFDEIKSILYIKGLSVRINIQDRITNAHKMLRHFFIVNEKNLRDDFYYAEVAEDEFHELDYTHRENNWRKYHYACEDINRKVERQTNGQIKDFLVFNTGIKGSVKINEKYL